MNVIKIAAGFACALIVVLFSLLIIIENPEKDLFDKTVESLMVQKGLASSQEVLDAFPELAEVNTKVKRIAYLKSSMHSITGGPAPDVSAEDAVYVQACADEIRQLQINIKEDLSQIMVTYASNQP